MGKMRGRHFRVDYKSLAQPRHGKAGQGEQKHPDESGSMDGIDA